MTIDEMPAGREMDALVAEKVFGLPAKYFGDDWRNQVWVEDEDSCGEWKEDAAIMVTHRNRQEYVKGSLLTSRLGEYEDTQEPVYQVLPEYSTKIADAWEVVEKTGLLARRVEDGLDVGLVLRQPDEDEWALSYRYGTNYVVAPTPELAICRAALKTVGYSPEGDPE